MDFVFLCYANISDLFCAISLSSDRGEYCTFIREMLGLNPGLGIGYLDTNVFVYFFSSFSLLPLPSLSFSIQHS
jgi:hypothetical protein